MICNTVQASCSNDLFRLRILALGSFAEMHHGDCNNNQDDVDVMITEMIKSIKIMMMMMAMKTLIIQS